MTPPRKETANAVSPGGGVTANSAAIVHLPPNDLSIFISGLIRVNLGTLPTAEADGVKESIKNLFDNLGVTEWSDLALFSVADIEDYFSSNKSTAITKRDIKALGKITEFVKQCPDSPDPNLLLTAIVSKLHAVNSLQVPSSPSSRRYIVDKKTVPTLKVFLGMDEDSFGWMEDTQNKLGSAGLARYLTDPTLVKSHPDVAESVFYALRQATHDGLAKSLSQSLMNRGLHDPTMLWSDLKGYYDTHVNKANVVLYEIKRLLNLELNAGVSPTQFIADFKDCLQKLNRQNASIANDLDTLRALLLVSIQDDAYESVRDDILKNPSTSIEDHLTAIREKDTSIQINDGVRDLQGDGDIRGRWVGWDPKVRDKEKDKKIFGGKTFRVPYFPPGWSTAIGKKLFKVLEQWRASANNGKPQSFLNATYELSTDEYTPGLKKFQKRKSSVRRSKHQKTKNDSQASGEESGNEDQSTEPKEKKMRIFLAKNNSILTEKRV